MDKKLADKIYKEVEEEWIKRHGKDKLNPRTLEALKLAIPLMPADKDGNKMVTDMETNETHLVPIKDIILDGLKGSELCKYPTLRDKAEKNE